MKRHFTVKLVCTTHQLPLVLKVGVSQPLWDQTAPGEWTLNHEGLACVGGAGGHDFMVTAAWESPDPPNREGMCNCQTQGHPEHGGPWHPIGNTGGSCVYNNSEALAAWLAHKAEFPKTWSWQCPHCPFFTTSLIEGQAHVKPGGGCRE